MKNNQIKLKEKIQTMFVDLNYNFNNTEIKDQHMIQVEVLHKKNSIFLKCATMCIYFEDKILAAAKEKWPNKNISLGYKSNIPLRYYTYRAFMRETVDFSLITNIKSESFRN